MNGTQVRLCSTDELAYWPLRCFTAGWCDVCFERSTTKVLAPLINNEVFQSHCCWGQRSLEQHLITLWYFIWSQVSQCAASTAYSSIDYSHHVLFRHFTCTAQHLLNMSSVGARIDSGCRPWGAGLMQRLISQRGLQLRIIIIICSQSKYWLVSMQNDWGESGVRAEVLKALVTDQISLQRYKDAQVDPPFIGKSKERETRL